MGVTLKMFTIDDRKSDKKKSIWRRDLTSIGFKEGQDKINFTDHIQCRLGVGRIVSFWHNLWSSD